MSLPDSLRLLFLLAMIGGLLWTGANVIESWRVQGWPTVVRIQFSRSRNVRSPQSSARRASVLRFPSERIQAS